MQNDIVLNTAENCQAEVFYKWMNKNIKLNLNTIITNLDTVHVAGIEQPNLIGLMWKDYAEFRGLEFPELVCRTCKQFMRTFGQLLWVTGNEAKSIMFHVEEGNPLPPENYVELVDHLNACITTETYINLTYNQLKTKVGSCGVMAKGCNLHLGVDIEPVAMLRILASAIYKGYEPVAPERRLSISSVDKDLYSIYDRNYDVIMETFDKIERPTLRLQKFKELISAYHHSDYKDLLLVEAKSRDDEMKLLLSEGHEGSLLTNLSCGLDPEYALAMYYASTDEGFHLKPSLVNGQPGIDQKARLATAKEAGLIPPLTNLRLAKQGDLPIIADHIFTGRTTDKERVLKTRIPEENISFKSFQEDLKEIIANNELVSVICDINLDSICLGGYVVGTEDYAKIRSSGENLAFFGWHDPIPRNATGYSSKLDYNTVLGLRFEDNGKEKWISLIHKGSYNVPVSPPLALDDISPDYKQYVKEIDAVSTEYPVNVGVDSRVFTHPDDDVITQSILIGSHVVVETRDKLIAYFITAHR